MLLLIVLIRNQTGFINLGFVNPQTPACDLKSDLALKIKRNILLALDKKQLPHKNPEKREQVYNTYKHYLEKVCS